MLNDNTIYTNSIITQFQELSTWGQHYDFLDIKLKKGTMDLLQIICIYMQIRSMLKGEVKRCQGVTIRTPLALHFVVRCLYKRVHSKERISSLLKCITTTRLNVQMTATTGIQKAIVGLFVNMIALYISMLYYIFF